MNSYSEHAIFNIPLNCTENNQDVREVEASAAKALKNINVLYNEIMSPKESLGLSNIANDGKFKNSLSKSSQNHCLKSCCSMLRELCINCDNFISQCSTCNQCNCSSASNKLKKYRNSKSSNRLVPINYDKNNLNNSQIKCTVPEPFSFNQKSAEWLKSKEHKISKLKDDINKRIENELKVRIHTKPVPKNTHLPLYNQMLQERQKQIAERKVKCFEILSNTRPFTLHPKYTDIAKCSSDQKICSFKAKPVPKNILSSKVSEKIKHKEEIRKMLIIERAKDGIKQSSLPFSQKYVPRSRSLIDINNYNKISNKNESKKNIYEITKKLYVKKCNETMNTWNEKVMEVDTCKKLEYIKTKLLNENMSAFRKSYETECMPFHYFPVRMSNAALLREKQIREEIMARKERDENRIQTEELSKKKANPELLLKLKNLIPSCEREKAIDEKVKSFRLWQMKRQQEYEKELEEILTRVAEQNLLLERQSKVTKREPEIKNCLGSESDDNETQESYNNKSQESFTTNSYNSKEHDQ